MTNPKQDFPNIFNALYGQASDDRDIITGNASEEELRPEELSTSEQQAVYILQTFNNNSRDNYRFLVLGLCTNGEIDYSQSIKSFFLSGVSEEVRNTMDTDEGCRRLINSVNAQSPDPYAYIGKDSFLITNDKTAVTELEKQLRHTRRPKEEAGQQPQPTADTHETGEPQVPQSTHVRRLLDERNSEPAAQPQCCPIM